MDSAADSAKSSVNNGQQQHNDTPSEPTSSSTTDPLSIILQKQPIEEMLGSVTTYNNVEGSDAFGSPKNCQQLRTSARVFKKMKLDNAQALTTVAASEKDKKDASSSDTAKIEVKKPLRPQWSPEDKDIFFEALNEYGKDFDAIQQHINNRFKKKGLPETLYKTKDQVRHFYYRTWHKISKHLKFSEDIKKLAQELYALINFGELRKKIGPVSEKTCLKLNELIYRGTVAIRVKGKTIRIKTPMCRALRKLNQIDEKHEDLKLPTRIIVELRPKNNETWLNVQFMSQNPRIRVSLPLQKRLSALISCVSKRWKSQLARTHEQVHTFLGDSSSCPSPLLRFAPKTSCSVEVPTINLSEYLTSHRICLNAYEERVGVKIPGEQLWQHMCASFKGGGKGSTKKGGTKRPRNESVGEKSIVKKEIKENCDEQESDMNVTAVSDVVDSAINTILALQNQETDSEELKLKTEFPKVEPNQEEVNLSVKTEEVLKIKNGWTLENCGSLTVGVLYLMFGSDSKLQLEYSWDVVEDLKTEPIDNELSVLPPETLSDQQITDQPEIKPTNEPSVILKQLLSLAKLHYRKERIRCPCGHVCGGPSRTSSASRGKSFAAKNNARNVEEHRNIPASKATTSEVPPQGNCMRNVTVKAEPFFRTPAIFPITGPSADSFRAQLDSLQRMKPKYTNRRGRPARNKHVVVERMLPLLPKPLVNGHSIVTMKLISQNQTELRAIAPRVDESAREVPMDQTPSEEQSILDESKEEPEFVSCSFFLNHDKENGGTSSTTYEEQHEHCTINNNIPEREVTSPTSISNFLDLDITAGDTNDLILPQSVTGVKDGLTSFAGFLSDDLPDSATHLSSPSRLLKETDNQWLNSEVNDYSLTSLLGHLESPMKTAPPIIPCDDEPISQDMDSQFPSLLGENGVDFVDQFVDMAAQVSTDTSDIQ